MRLRIVPLLLVPGLCLASAACSSDGGQSAPQATQITADNATEVASALGVTMTLLEFQGFVDMNPSTSPTFNGGEPCSGGGSVTAELEIDIPPVDQISQGDRFAITFGNCNEGGAVLNGRLVADFDAVQGDPEVDPTWTLGFTFGIENVTITNGSNWATFNGDIGFDLSEDNGDADFSLSGEFHGSVNNGGQVLSQSLTGLNLTCVYEAMTQMSTYSFGGMFFSSTLGGVVTLQTTSPFVAMGEENPHTGQLLITGANSSSLRITVIDTMLVMLEVDEDGDSVVDLTITSSWDEV